MRLPKRLLDRLESNWPFFAAGPRARLSVRIEHGCSFRYRRRIDVGRAVRFLRGAVLLADANGTVTLHDGAVVCRYAVVQSAGGSIEIGERSSIGDFCSLYGQGGLRIGRDVMLASGVRVIPAGHTFDDPEIAVARQPTTARGVAIADGAWLGANVVVLDGVTIGRNAVVGAGSVVTRPVPDGAVAMGVPARVVSQR